MGSRGECGNILGRMGQMENNRVKITRKKKRERQMVIYVNVANNMDRQEIKTRTVRKDDICER